MISNAICGLCLTVGTVMPWAFLVGGAALNLLPLPDIWHRGATYLMVLALAVLALSAFWQAITRHHRTS